MKQAIHIVEDGFFRDLPGITETGTDFFQYPVGDSVSTDVIIA